jgi:hypothetical protein
VSLVAQDLTALIAMAAERGCGVTLADIERDPDFGQLLADWHHHPYAQQAARIQALGRELIRAGGDCLPADLLTLADEWPTASADKQLSILEELGAQLTSANWYQIRGLQWQHHGQVDADVLPFGFGPWASGLVIPCCVGMATLLAGFAKRAGAPHLFTQVLRSRVLEVQSLDFELRSAVMQRLQDRLPRLVKAGGLADMEAKLGRVKEALEAQEAFTFHPALIIQLCDGRWVLVDAFFETRVVLEEAEFHISKISAMLNGATPGRVVLTQSYDRLNERIRRLNAEAGAVVSSVQGILLQLEDLDGQSGFKMASMLLRHLSQMGEKLAFMAPLVQGLSDKNLQAQGLFDAQVTPLPTRDEVAEAWRRLGTDPDYARLAVERMLEFVVHCWYKAVIIGLRELRDTMPPVSLEVALPEVAVAVGTLNNLRCYYEADPFDVGGILVMFYRSQTIWHDSILAIQCEGGAVPQDVAARLGQMKEALAEIPPNLLHPHVAQLLAELTHE